MRDKDEAGGLADRVRKGRWRMENGKRKGESKGEEDMRVENW